VSFENTLGMRVDMATYRARSIGFSFDKGEIKRFSV
jgi:hypothetical protein